MDFFAAQEHARRQSSFLVVYFALGMLGLVASIYFVVAILFRMNTPDDSPLAMTIADVPLFYPNLLAAVAGATSAVVGAGSLYKIAQLSKGGETVALMLGGRPINVDTRDPAERKILNIVEEMAIASGVPVPPVYLLENEQGINAFAAGHKPSDAVIGVTRGSIDLLTRDELQGVMGHEFSHILNGDMKLNLRITGLIYGILVISTIGYYILRSQQNVMIFGLSSSRQGRSESKGDPRALFMLFGLALFVLGYIGVIFGQLIRAAVSRQREYLADASAVQFTRNPEGIAYALAKIGGWSAGSRVAEAHAGEVSHMFFSTAVSQLFATHPPLADRIKRVLPQWDGTFPDPRQAAPNVAVPAPAKPKRGPLPGGFPIPFPIGTQGVLQKVGEPRPENIATAAAILESLSPPITDASHETFSAQGLVYALLLHADQDVRSRQLTHLQRELKPSIFEATLKLVPTVQAMPAGSRLPTVELALPALRQLTRGQYTHFRDNILNLVHADQRITLFEFVLQIFVVRCLDEQFGLRKSKPAKISKPAEVSDEVARVISLLAHVGNDDPAVVRALYEKSWKAFDSNLPVPMVAKDELNLTAFGDALEHLAEAVPALKRRITSAATACVVEDAVVSVAEFELLRAVASVLETPMPPLQVTPR
jgi:Zn-dependent protease with chaperone function